jgi:hypothetical protein
MYLVVISCPGYDKSCSMYLLMEEFHLFLHQKNKRSHQHDVLHHLMLDAVLFLYVPFHFLLILEATGKTRSSSLPPPKNWRRRSRLAFIPTMSSPSWRLSCVRYRRRYVNSVTPPYWSMSKATFPNCKSHYKAIPPPHILATVGNTIEHVVRPEEAVLEVDCRFGTTTAISDDVGDYCIGVDVGSKIVARAHKKILADSFFSRRCMEDFVFSKTFTTAPNGNTPSAVVMIKRLVLIWSLLMLEACGTSVYRHKACACNGFVSFWHV